MHYLSQDTWLSMDAGIGKPAVESFRAAVTSRVCLQNDFTSYSCMVDSCFHTDADFARRATQGGGKGLVWESEVGYEFQVHRF